MSQRAVGAAGLLLLLALNGCALWTPEYVGIDPTDPVVAALLEKHAWNLEALKAVEADYEALLEAISEDHAGAEVLDVGAFGGELVAKLEPIAEQAAESAAERFAQTLSQNPTGSGLLEALLGALAGGATVYGARTATKKRAAVKAKAKAKKGATK